MTRTLKSFFRLWHIAFVLARHDALSVLEGLASNRSIAVILGCARLLRRRNFGCSSPLRPGEKMALALIDLGPVFVKFGQFLSTRADLLGDDLAGDLAQLQDQLPPFDGAKARALIAADLGAPLEQFFQQFEPTPISAASIAQVHFAVSTDGEEVAVKILRPNATQHFQRDLALFHHLARVVTRAKPALARLRLCDVVQTFDDMVKLEMDLRMEAAAACELAQNFAGDTSYQTPRIDWIRTSRNVMTMSRVRGIPLDDRAALVAAGHHLPDILSTAARIFFHQVFRDGFFHGDQHPGNMLVGPAGQIVAVDFGIMGRIDYQTRTFLADMLLALLEEDYNKLAEAHRTGGLISDSVSLSVFSQALRSVCQPIMGQSLNSFSFARLLGQMFHLSKNFNMTIQPQLLLLQKNMVMAEGISRQLDENLNIWIFSRPLIEQWIRENRGPQARLRQQFDSLCNGLEHIPTLVQNLDRLSQKINGLKLDPDSLNALRPRHKTTGHLALLLALIALGFSASSLL